MKQNLNKLAWLDITHSGGWTKEDYLKVPLVFYVCKSGVMVVKNRFGRCGGCSEEILETFKKLAEEEYLKRSKQITQEDPKEYARFSLDGKDYFSEPLSASMFTHIAKAVLDNDPRAWIHLKLHTGGTLILGRAQLDRGVFTFFKNA